MPLGLAYAVAAVALGGAFTGYLSVLHRRRWVDPAFLPATICAGTALAGLTGGLLGALPQTASGVLLVGSLALGYSLWRHPGSVHAALLEPSTLTFGLLGTALAVVLHGRRFMQYDDFSHWALVVKVLLGTDALPDLGDPVVSFRAYAPGSASFIYAVCRFLAPGEDRLMAAQAVLIAAGCVALHAVPLRRRWLGPPLVLGAMLIVAWTGIALDSLLVDTLLAVYLLVPLLLVVRHAGTLRRTWPVASVLVAFLPTIKASGVLLAVIAVLAIQAVSLARRAALRWRVLPIVGAPAAVTYCWNRHVLLTFPDGAGRYALPRDPAAIPVKTPEQRTEIIAAYVDFLRTEPRLQLALALGVPVLLGLVAVGALRRRSAVLVAAGSALALLAWLLAVLTLYLTAMPFGEARHLAGSRRYVGTASTLALLLVFTAFAVLLDRARGWMLVAGSAGSVVLVLAWLPQNEYLLRPQQLDGTPRAHADAALARAGPIAPGASVCVVEDRRDAGYRRFMLRYLLTTDRVIERIVNTERDRPQALLGCRYAVVLEPNPPALDQLRRDGFAVTGNPPLIAERTLTHPR